MNLSAAIYNRLSDDGALAALLADYHGGPAVFTVDPAPADAVLPYLVSAGQVTDRASDTKTTRGREVWRDMRCYTAKTESAALVEEIAELVRALLHRHRLAVSGYETWIAEASGPTVADEDDAYGRIVHLRLVLMES